MATTADGLPYPVGTDKVVNGDDAIRDLANALQLRGGGKRLQAARFTGTTQPNGVARINFPAPFTGAPVVSAWLGWGYPNAGAAFLMYENVTFGWDANGFHVLLRNHDGTGIAAVAIDVMYIAIGAA